jgi:proprotein convertase subtilisin/kexin type 5
MNGECVPCADKCIKCQGKPDHCTVCSYERKPEPPACPCKDGEFENAEGKCQDCDPKCLTCKNKADECTKCAENRVSPPKCPCKSHFFENEHGVCVECAKKCKECEGDPYHCTVCDKVRVPGSESDCPCPPNQFEKNGECHNCPKKCKHCESDKICIDCASETRGGENCECLPGFFETGDVHCSPCSSKCIECKGAADYCTKCALDRKPSPPECPCKDGFVEVGEVCEACSYKCVTCVDTPEKCVVCADHRHKPPTCSCPPGTFDNGTPDCQ